VPQVADGAGAVIKNFHFARSRLAPDPTCPLKLLSIINHQVSRGCSGEHLNRAAWIGGCCGAHVGFTSHRLSRHAIRYKGDLRTSSAPVLDTPMSASSRSSSSSRNCLRWHRRSHAVPASHASGIFQDHLRSATEGEAASRVLVELQVVLPQDMFHLRNGEKQRLAAEAHRAVVNGPSDFFITPTFGAQAIVSGQAEGVSSSGRS
jgi:hypothetical protein